MERLHVWTYNDCDHAYSALFAGNISGEYQDQDGNGYCGNCQAELDVLLVHHDYDELNGKAEEEEEIKFKQSNVDLKNKLAYGNISVNRTDLVC